MEIKNIFLVLMLILAGCTSQAEPSEKPIIAVTSYPMYDFTRNVIGEDPEIELWLMLPPGLNAHSYEPTPNDIVKLNKVDAFVYTTKYFEIWADKTLQSLDRKKLTIIDASKNVELVEPEDETLGPIDPHTWLSPKNAIVQVETISQDLQKTFPKKKDQIQKNTEAYKQKLQSLDSKYESTIKTCKHREMFVSHAAFGYLAKHYSLNQIPVIKNFDPQGEVSLSDLKKVIEKAKEKNASHIFFEDFISPKLSEQVAKEINGKTAIFSPMEAYAEPQINQDSYIQVMERNLDVLKEALECE